MSVWMELRCERRGDGRCEYSGTRCMSDSNDGPGFNAGDQQSGLIEGYKSLKMEAYESGWKLIRGEGWVCPRCLSYEITQKGTE